MTTFSNSMSLSTPIENLDYDIIETKYSKNLPSSLLRLMTFKLKNLNSNLHNISRDIGYRPLKITNQDELGCVRPLYGNYPRFHIYMKEEKGIITFNIHLDQKKPSYEGTHAHGGDYDSETVKKEIQRIKDLLLR
jgi:hypothetical protein